MEAAMRHSSRRIILVLTVVNLFFPDVIFSSNFKMYPEDLPMEACELSNGKEGICVYGYLCRDSIINVDGSGIIDLRFSDVCEDYFLKCCSKETPCLENAGTCVAASNCGANMNDPKNRQFKQSDECDWSGFTCCPNGKIGQSNVTNQTGRESCDSDSFCVPYEQCKVNPDGNGLLSARTSADCTSQQHTCCPESMIIEPGPGSGDVQSNSIEQYETCDDHTVCVLDDQCSVKPDGDTLIQARASVCDLVNHTCCPKDKVKGNDPCNEVGGICIQESLCPASASLKFDLRISQCDDFGSVCCMQDATGERDQYIGKTCSGGKGKCTPKKQCRGTTYRDRNKDCGGLACCATLQTTTPRSEVSTSTTRNPTDNENSGKACFKNLGICTMGSCVGVKYTDRKKECGGLNCCAAQTTPTSVISTTTLKPVDNGKEGKACYSNLGKCTRNNCLETKYNDRKNECGGLNCCAEVQVDPSTDNPTDPSIDSSAETPNGSDRSCISIGGKCELDENCQKKADGQADDCEDNEVCCLQGTRGGPEPVELIRECGYRNDNGVKFNTTGRGDGESQFGEFPWMVAILVNENGKLKYSCGGSLIDPEVVLTTATCAQSFRRSPDKAIIRAGEWDLGTIREPIAHEERRVIKVKRHPHFKETTLVNNIALLFLNDKFDQSLTINTVCLPPQNLPINNGWVTASGWGSTPKDRTKKQQILKSFDMQYVESTVCESTLRRGMTNRNFKLHPSFLCAGGELGVDTCTGDAGSPIVFPIPNDRETRYYAIGMVSWGIGCGRAGIPAAYTDIRFFRDWIDNEVQKEGLHDHYYTYIQQDQEED